jgi:hypothetical protein
MSNDLTPPDDGFGGSLGDLTKRVSNFARWNDTQHWRDRDGIAMTGQYLIGVVGEGLRRWKDKVPTLLLEKPLPDPDQLNSEIPITEWENGLTGNPQPPWRRVVLVLLIDPATGALYQFISDTWGARIAFNLLQEAVIVMRSLRGAQVLPLVNLSERPMKTNFGWSTRPHFEIISWKTPGGDPAAIPPKPTPQIAAPAPTPTPTPPATPATTPPAQPRQPKQPVNLSEYTKAVMGDVKPVTTEEFLDDSLDALPWDQPNQK